MLSCMLGMHEDPPGRGRVAWLFLRLLGVLYAVAFASFAVQARVLVGSEGLLPWAKAASRADRWGMWERLHRMPTVLLWATGDEALVWAGWLGAALGLALVANVAPKLIALVLWALYLSVSVAGQAFYHFQWDNLLIETGLLAVVLAPGGLRPGAREPSSGAVLLLRWLFFRVFFESGVAKLASGDETWRDLTAMVAYYETAPLPTAGGWWLHQLPEWAHKASALLTLAGELGLPFLMFFGRRGRLIAFLGAALFSATVAFSANYAFFNHLSVVIALMALDDRHLATLAERLGRRMPPAGPATRRGSETVVWARRAIVAVLLLLPTVDFVESLGRGQHVPAPVGRVNRWLAPFRSFNTYHLFANMTGTRDEVEIQGTDDGREWRAYRFHHKPGATDRAPTFVAPHQPRVDFQLWFLTLSWRRRAHPYFTRLMEQLCHDPPAVADLFSVNPWPTQPPKALRVAIHRYTFGNIAEWRRAGTYWRREPRGHLKRIWRCDASPG